MMEDRLAQQIKQMQEVHHLEQVKKNKAAQDKANAQYREKLEQAHRLMLTLFELNARFSFSLKQETVDALRSALVQLKAVPYNGLPAQDRLDEVSRAFKPVEGSIKAEWKKHHASMTASTLRILQITQTLEPELCRSVIQNVRAGAEWTIAPNGYKPLYEALRQSSEVIQRMNVSEEVIRFLERMNRGAATIADLNPEVMTWLHDQALIDKIYLKFGRG